MTPRTLCNLVTLSAALASLAACQRDAPTPAARDVAPATPVGAIGLPIPRSGPVMEVTKNASCGCCIAWVDAMRKAGFAVEVHDVDNLDPIKTRLGIPAGKAACHTAQVGRYFIEGHVPAEDIRRLLAEQPDAKGLVLPGMPSGSPGMEVPGSTPRPYTVELVRADGSTEVFATHGQ